MNVNIMNVNMLKSIVLLSLKIIEPRLYFL